MIFRRLDILILVLTWPPFRLEDFVGILKIKTKV